ncbi:MAG: hypothetical protein ACFFAN_00610 [Promethearchaeota archaeon]
MPTCRICGKEILQEQYDNNNGICTECVILAPIREEAQIKREIKKEKTKKKMRKKILICIIFNLCWIILCIIVYIITHL